MRAYEVWFGIFLASKYKFRANHCAVFKFNVNLAYYENLRIQAKYGKNMVQKNSILGLLYAIRLLDMTCQWKYGRGFKFAAISHKLKCMKSVSIRSFSGPYFPIFKLNTETYSVSLPIQSECGKIVRISPYLERMRENTDQKKLHIWTLFTHKLSANILRTCTKLIQAMIEIGLNSLTLI